MFRFINHVHHFLDALLMLRYLHWVQISFILSCSTLFFSIVYHLHKMYVSGISFFQNLERWLGNLVLQYDAPPFFFAFLLKFDHITHGSPEKFKPRDVCVCTHIYDYMWFVIRNCLLQLWSLKNPNMHCCLADGDWESQWCGSSLKGCR